MLYGQSLAAALFVCGSIVCQGEIQPGKLVNSSFSPESVITCFRGSPTVQLIVVSTDFEVTVGLVLAVQAFEGIDGPNVGA